ncbi:MAG: threonine ammonia-lyase, biosynthetic [Gammaproteobacteria bacterium]|nr:MAG: threonine ammonia-lyase, biosynthetic [Gammaproteobacteria bacterium]
MPRDYVERILKARVYDVARESPLERAPRLSRRLDNDVLLKREDLQPVFSFKVRGAYNKICSLTAEERERGVIASSAGNHAQGVALAANRLGVKALIVMPKTTPRIKVEAVRDLGAEIVLHGSSYDEARTHADGLAGERGMMVVPPFDDPEVIAGQGTVALEILRQHGSDIHAIFVAVGGGGLIAGIAAYVKSLWPQIRIIGVEPEDAPSMQRSLEAGERVVLDHVGIFADGVAVKQVGEEPFRIARQCVDEVLLVSTDEICAAIKDIYEDTRSIAEPAGALGVAGLKRYVEREGTVGATLVAVDSGANVNFDRLRHIAERAELGDRREALLAVTIPERPGSLREFCHAIGARSITEFNYRYANAGDAHIFVGVELRDVDSDRDALIRGLVDRGYPVVDMTDNEMAKIHIRYMVGGRSGCAGEEQLYRLNFPERPGALLRFLTHMGEHWNISLFHYRNHGADYGRVLIGVQVPSDETAAFQSFLSEIGYDYAEESGNPAYDLFLK